ncbi:unnamed protein product [Urochloa decumbens]|uniref:F-box domain-containing protein n=1 Tax=Urochloa decumbens TaxID=240449 RepID=A0ABC8VGH9_9POAL
MKMHKTGTKEEARTTAKYHSAHLMEEIVLEILARLPVRSLLRFSTFSNNFRFYQWPHPPPQHGCITSSPNNNEKNVATFLDAKEFPRQFRTLRYFTHCDGLVFAPTNARLYVFNPATRDAITLPDSDRNNLRAGGGRGRLCYSAGLGLDPRTGKYKVVQAFYHRSLDDPATTMGSTTDMGMEELRGILFLSLEEEEFGICGLPDDLDPEDDDFTLDALHGRDLCVTAFNRRLEMLTVWTLPTADEGLCTLWERRYSIPFSGPCCVMALPPYSNGGRIILWQASTLYCFELETNELKILCELRRLSMKDIDAS